MSSPGPALRKPRPVRPASAVVVSPALGYQPLSAERLHRLPPVPWRGRPAPRSPGSSTARAARTMGCHAEHGGGDERRRTPPARTRIGHEPGQRSRRRRRLRPPGDPRCRPPRGMKMSLSPTTAGRPMPACSASLDHERTRASPTSRFVARADREAVTPLNSRFEADCATRRPRRAASPRRAVAVAGPRRGSSGQRDALAEMSA